MNKDNLIQDNLFQWLQQERQKDLLYWKDRASNGNGLIKTVAGLVINSGESVEK